MTSLDHWQDLFLSYTHYPIVVIDKSDLDKVQIGVRQWDGTWRPMVVKYTSIWDYLRCQQNIEEHQESAEKLYFDTMNSLVQKRKDLQKWFQRS